MQSAAKAIVLAAVSAISATGVLGAVQGISLASNPAVSMTAAPSTPQNLGAFTITIAPGPGLAANPSALAAFNRAANQWAAYIADPITVTINADLGTFANPNTIGSAGSVSLMASFNTIRNAMVADAADEPSNAIVASLPTAAQFTANVPSGKSIGANVVLTKANAKALNFGGLDAGFGVSDGTITFNQAFAFDYDNSNGVTPGTMDFETVASHEIGHVLGFVSSVDDFDQGATSTDPTTVDLFRFERLANNPANASQFTTFARNLVPGADTIFDHIAGEYRFSTGVALGDGRQASHWKDDALTGTYLGMLDPTLSYGTVQAIRTPDLIAMDLIGYDVVVPEPAMLLTGLTGSLVLLRRRRRLAKA